MGITIADSITFDSGIALTNTYASFSNASDNGMNIPITSYKTTSGGSTVYRVSGTIFIYKDQDAKNADKKHLGTVSVTKDLTSSELGTISSTPSKNVYGHLYTQLKTNYSSTSDVE